MNLLRNRRLLVLVHALRGRTSGGGIAPFLRNVLSPPCDTIAASYIESISEEEGMRVVRLAGFPDPLFFPMDADLHMLHQVLAEMMKPWAWHYYEVPETRVGPDDVVLDCGAAEGLFAFVVRRRARQVYAFEPVPSFQRSLERTFRDAPNVEVVPAALADRPGRAYMQRHGIEAAITDQPTDMPTEVMTVDAFCAGRGIVPTYIKADLEGWELRLLEGARDTISRHRPRIAITTYHHHGDADRLAAFLLSVRPDYRLRLKGIEHNCGEPVMLHAW